MTDRKEFEMSQAQLDAILDACKPVPYMIIGGQPPMSVQESANAAWRRLGDELGFEFMTVRPGKSQRHFSAQPKETVTP